MLDPRMQRLAELLVRHSVRVQPGEKVLIEAYDIPTDMTVALIKAVAAVGGQPLVSTYQQPVLRALYQAATADQMQLIGAVERQRMEGVQCYIGMRGSNNTSEMSDVPRDKMDLYERHWWNHVHSQVRVPKTKWVVLRWPSPAMAQSAGMSTEAFEDYYFNVCAGVDYDAMQRAMEPLEALMRRTDQVHIKGPGTDLRFSIKGIGVVPCFGERNIPDGEIYTCPVKTSVEGYITYNCETLYRGTLFTNVHFAFDQGKIVKAEAGANTAKLNEILDSDEGARYLGEWSFGVNPYISNPMRDTLFDEKIAGSFHLTPGQCYKEASNGNDSQIHWDIVCRQDPAVGGGEIWFDGVLIRKDGRFVLPELQGLNPEALTRA
ncbi:MAG: aminopeptidase [Chloroflexi bacterium]|nr:MAG: aminopeptidase [Chloroflexota bacterium]